jgi:hypothetical protein
MDLANLDKVLKEAPLSVFRVKVFSSDRVAGLTSAVAGVQDMGSILHKAQLLPPSPASRS